LISRWSKKKRQGKKTRKKGLLFLERRGGRPPYRQRVKKKTLKGLSQLTLGLQANEKGGKKRVKTKWFDRIKKKYCGRGYWYDKKTGGNVSTVSPGKEKNQKGRAANNSFHLVGLRKPGHKKHGK